VATTKRAAKKSGRTNSRPGSNSSNSHSPKFTSVLVSATALSAAVLGGAALREQ